MWAGQTKLLCGSCIVWNWKQSFLLSCLLCWFSITDGFQEMMICNQTSECNTLSNSRLWQIAKDRMKNIDWYTLDLSNVKLSVKNIFLNSYLKCVFKKTQLFRMSMFKYWIIWKYLEFHILNQAFYNFVTALHTRVPVPQPIKTKKEITLWIYIYIHICL